MCFSSSCLSSCLPCWFKPSHTSTNLKKFLPEETDHVRKRSLKRPSLPHKSIARSAHQDLPLRSFSKSTARLNLALSSIDPNSFTILTTADATITEVYGLGAKTILGYKKEDLIGRKVYTFVHPEDSINLVHLVHSDSRKKLRAKRDSYTWRWLSKTGSPVALEIVSILFGNEHTGGYLSKISRFNPNAPVYRLGEDAKPRQKSHISQKAIDEKFDLERHLLQKEAELANFKTFFSALRHEFGNIFNGIKGRNSFVLETLRKLQGLKLKGRPGILIPLMMVGINDVQISQERAIAYLERMKDFRKYSSKRITLRKRTFSLNTLLLYIKREAVSLLQKKALKKKRSLLSASHQLEKETKIRDEQVRVILQQPSQDAMLYSDKEKLLETLCNIINNACKFTSKGTIRIVCRHTKFDKNTYDITFKIFDSGIGIKKKECGFIFNPFQQANDLIYGRYGGTGLGLYMSKKIIVEGFKGSIQVSSEFGRGSVFTVKIRSQKSIRIKKSPSSLRINTKSLMKEIAGMRVLVAEDCSINQKVIERQLQKLGVNFTIVNDGAPALRLLKKSLLSGSPYEIVFLDLNMISMHGWDTSIAFRAWESKNHLQRKSFMDFKTLETSPKSPFSQTTFLPILALTGSDSPSCRAHSKKAKMQGFITKPFSNNQLLKALVTFKRKPDTTWFTFDQ